MGSAGAVAVPLLMLLLVLVAHHQDGCGAQFMRINGKRAWKRGGGGGDKLQAASPSGTMLLGMMLPMAEEENLPELKRLMARLAGSAASGTADHERHRGDRDIDDLGITFYNSLTPLHDTMDYHHRRRLVDTAPAATAARLRAAAAAAASEGVKKLHALG